MQSETNRSRLPIVAVVLKPIFLEGLRIDFLKSGEWQYLTDQGFAQKELYIIQINAF